MRERWRSPWSASRVVHCSAGSRYAFLTHPLPADRSASLSANSDARRLLTRRSIWRCSSARANRAKKAPRQTPTTSPSLRSNNPASWRSALVRVTGISIWISCNMIWCALSRGIPADDPPSWSKAAARSRLDTYGVLSPSDRSADRDALLHLFGDGPRGASGPDSPSSWVGPGASMPQTHRDPVRLHALPLPPRGVFRLWLGFRQAQPGLR